MADAAEVSRLGQAATRGARAAPSLDPESVRNVAVVVMEATLK